MTHTTRDRLVEQALRATVAWEREHPPTDGIPEDEYGAEDAVLRVLNVWGSQPSRDGKPARGTWPMRWHGLYPDFVKAFQASGGEDGWINAYARFHLQPTMTP